MGLCFLKNTSTHFCNENYMIFFSSSLIFRTLNRFTPNRIATAVKRSWTLKLIPNHSWFPPFFSNSPSKQHPPASNTACPAPQWRRQSPTRDFTPWHAMTTSRSTAVPNAKARSKLHKWLAAEVWHGWILVWLAHLNQSSSCYEGNWWSWKGDVTSWALGKISGDVVWN